MKIVVLLSGGLDSATVLCSLREYRRKAVAFDYGQKHSIELERAAELAAAEQVPFGVVKIPAISKVDETVFAGRNAVLIAHAASIAAATEYSHVAIGSNCGDWERFPDCRPTFVKAMDAALQEGYGVRLIAPLLHMSKRQVVDLARELSVPIERTWSCYSPQDETPCGKCLACEVRTEAGA